ncbi:MAG: hypothetical protein H7338_11445 [Candidatus Sericytochromatia bacterium]|nr:hypothetical protein [Candidatus Sericytochromatia bacterium]
MAGHAIHRGKDSPDFGFSFASSVSWPPCGQPVTPLAPALQQDTRPNSGETRGSARAYVALASSGLTPGPRQDAAIVDLLQVARTEANAINQSMREATGGHGLSKGFNRFVNVFTHKGDRLEGARRAAVTALTSTLPKDLETFHGMLSAAGNDPVRRQRAGEFLDGALKRVQKVTDAYAGRETDFSKSNKFWSGIAADTIAGVGVVAGLALCATGVGAPAGAALVAGAFAAGGTLSIGAHVALDNQFNFKKEGLATFVVGGLSGAATALTAGASTAVSGRVMTGAAKVFGKQAAQGALIKGAALAVGRGVTYGVAGASISGVQAIADESQHGFKPGAGGRIAKAMGVGGVGGFVGGAVWSGVSSAAGQWGGPALQRVSPTLSNRVTAIGSRIDGSKVGRVLMSTASGAFYGGPVGAAGTWIAAKMTGQTMTGSELWHQAIGGAIQGGLVYGAWASTKAGNQNLEAAGSNAVEVPGRRTPAFRRTSAASTLIRDLGGLRPENGAKQPLHPQTTGKRSGDREP